MPSPRREKAAPWGEAALGVTTQPLNSTASPATVSSTGATLREDPLQGWFDLAKPAFDASRDSFEISTSRLLGEKL